MDRFVGGANAFRCDDVVGEVDSASVQDNDRSALPPKSNVDVGMEGSSHCDEILSGTPSELCMVGACGICGVDLVGGNRPVRIEGGVSCFSGSSTITYSD